MINVASLRYSIEACSQDMRNLDYGVTLQSLPEISEVEFDQRRDSCSEDSIIPNVLSPVKAVHISMDCGSEISDSTSLKSIESITLAPSRDSYGLSSHTNVSKSTCSLVQSAKIHEIENTQSDIFNQFNDSEYCSFGDEDSNLFSIERKPKSIFEWKIPISQKMVTLKDCTL